LSFTGDGLASGEPEGWLSLDICPPLVSSLVFSYLLTQSVSHVAVGKCLNFPVRSWGKSTSGALLAACLHLVAQGAKQLGAALTSSAAMCTVTAAPCPLWQLRESWPGFLILCSYKHNIAWGHQLRLWAVLLKCEFCKRFTGLCSASDVLSWPSII